MDPLSYFRRLGQPKSMANGYPQGGYCLSYKAALGPLTIGEALDRRGNTVQLALFGARQPELAGREGNLRELRGKLQDVYADTGRSPGHFAQVGPVLVNLGHVVKCNGARTGDSSKPLSLLKKLATLPQSHKVFMSNSPIRERTIKGIAEHSSAVMIEVDSKWCNLNHVAEIRDSEGIAPQDQEIEIKPLIDVLAELGSSQTLYLHCPRAEHVFGRLLRLHVDTSAILLEMQPLEGGKSLLINLAHVATIEAKSDLHLTPVPTSSRRVEVKSLDHTLTNLKGYLLQMEVPFAPVPQGAVRNIGSDPSKGGFVLHIGRDAIPLAEVATLMTLAHESWVFPRLQRVDVGS